ncbi:MAG: ABC transporter ATP-binding protein [Roseovarius sp.]|nr:ABC transporter ATP-binding protein [Roseovarius sp.]
MARNRTREIPLLKNLATLESALDANDVRDASEGQIRPFLVAEKLQYNAANGTALVQDVSFSVDERTILAIAGPNGAGKTTLLRLLSGSEAPTGGDVLVGGRNLKRLSAKNRARMIAVVSQQEQPDGRLFLRDYVALGQIPIQADRSSQAHADDVKRILRLTSLTDLAETRMAVLSGGERQRAHIARALAQNPSLLFLDEPTNHLDPDAKGRMLSLIAELGITVVMIVHDLVMIPEFASHVALINAARLAGFGPVNEVLTPDRVHDIFGVSYLQFAHQGRLIPALDIRKNETPMERSNP